MSERWKIGESKWFDVVDSVSLNVNWVEIVEASEEIGTNSKMESIFRVLDSTTIVKCVSARHGVQNGDSKMILKKFPILTG